MERIKLNGLAAFFLLLMVACTWLGIASYVPRHQQAEAYNRIFDTFQWTVNGTMITVFSVVTVTLVAGCFWLAYIAYQAGIIWRSAARLRAAQALQAQREAQLQITVAQPGSQVYASEVSGPLKIEHKPLYLSPGRINGVEIQATPQETQRWAFFQLTQSISKKPESALELPEPEVLPLPDRVDLSYYVQAPSLRNVFLGIGRLPDGRVQPISAPLEQLVHIATGGASGFGKSTFMQALAYQVLNARELPSPVMLDPQAVTFSPFAGDERLLYPLASDPKMIALILSELVKEMQRRQQLFGKWRGIQNLSQYNQVVSPADRLAPIPIFFDEFGLLAKDKAIEKYSTELSNGGRKSGISLIVGTQHWGYDALSTAFRANLSTSIQFYARDKTESRILLGDSAAADITRKGQAFARLPGQAGLIELQAPDPAAFVNVPPELLPETVDYPLSNLKDRLDGEDIESSAGFTERVIELHRAGNSLSAISQQLFGYRNQAKLDQIRQVLADNGFIG